MKGKILISTGGSGGHVIPAITIHDHLKENYNILISTDVRGLKYLDDKSYETVVIDTPKLNNFILFPLSILKVFLLILRSLITLKKEKIQILISTGRLEPFTVMAWQNMRGAKSTPQSVSMSELNKSL